MFCCTSAEAIFPLLPSVLPPPALAPLLASRTGWEGQSVALTVYAVQLLLNFMWTPLFFKLHKLDWATYDILGMLLAQLCSLKQAFALCMV